MKKPIKPEAKKEVLRFDVELTDEQWKKFDALLARCYRSRKNFAEALIILCIEGESNTVLLDKLGVIQITSYNAQDKH